ARRRAPCHAARAGARQQPGRAGREGVGSAVVSLRRSSIVLALFVGLLVPAATSPQARIAVPARFHVHVFAPTLAGAPFMTLDPAGTILLSLPRQGRVVALPDDNHDGRADATLTVVDGLNLAHGLAFHEGELYIAEIAAVKRFRYDVQARKASDGRVVVSQ